MEDDVKLDISEIFYSIQGESTWAGVPTVFIRLAGCNLNCSWCDTVYAQKPEGKYYSISELINIISKYSVRVVEITGGEPMLQAGANILMKKLIENGYRVLLETNGTIPLKNTPPGVIKIMDIKCPSSGMHEKTLWENLQYLNPFNDEIKFVIADRNDYEFAVKMIEEKKLHICCRAILFSPILDRLPPHELAHWILKDRLNVRLQLQLHKIIWGNNVRGV
ncbi:MAG: radical SAM protein [Candidatus Hydrogenedentes bacterium]|nr:radical SAM protein [Candidatus Hydrogenedentota bacterium]